MALFSYPPGGGGSAFPGTSTDTQVLFNNAGAVGGFGSWDGTVQGFAANTGLSLAAGAPYGPTTFIGGEYSQGGLASSNAVFIDNPTDEYVAFIFSQYTDLVGVAELNFYGDTAPGGTSFGSTLQVTPGIGNNGGDLRAFGGNGSSSNGADLFLQGGQGATAGTAYLRDGSNTGLELAAGVANFTAALQIGGKAITLSGNFTTTGAFNPTFAIPSSSTWTFPSGGGTLALASSVPSFPLSVANGGTGGSSASITLFNNITGLSAAGTTGTTSTNLVFSTSPTLVTPVLGVATGTGLTLTPAVGASGLTIANVTQTGASSPVEDLAQTWNNAATVFTAWKLNVTRTASSGGILADWQLGGVSHMRLNYNAGAPQLELNSGGLLCTSGAVDALTHTVRSGGVLRISDGTDFNVALQRESGNTLSQYGASATAAQAYRNYSRRASASDANYVEIAHATQTLASVSGATVTATSLIPAGAFVVGVSTTVTVSLGTGGGTTGYTVGDGSDADRWGAVTGTAAGTDTDNTDWTTTTLPMFNAAQDVVITANGGNFNGTGSIFIDVSYVRGIAV